MGKNNRVVMKRMLHNPTAVMGVVIFLIIAFCAIFEPWTASYGINKVSIKKASQSPSAKHLFGTDNLGRDIFSKLLVGARYSLMIDLEAEVITLFGGLVVGSITGFFSQQVDDVIMRLCDVIQSIPGMVSNIALVVVLGLGIVPCSLAPGTGGIAENTRIIRANILKIRKDEFVDAASSINYSTPRIIIRHVLLNTISPMIVSATMDMARSITATSSLSYLGFGAQPPNPEWGIMLSAGRDYVLSYPYMRLAPGIIIAITVLSLNLIGDGLQGALDPELEK